MKKSVKKWISVLLAAAMIAGTGHAAYAGPSEPFYRRDAKASDQRQLPNNCRFLTEGKYELHRISAKYGIDPSYTPSMQGLDSLHISGSAQYSEPQFRELAGQLRALAAGDPVYVIDLRQESHAFLNGNAVSYYGNDNQQNIGMKLPQVEADEEMRFRPMQGTTQTVYKSTSRKESSRRDIAVENVMTERELAESEGFGYLRLCCTDHEWPDADQIDRFIEFVRGIDMNHVWLHFHCYAGQGRTSTFMSIYDMMKNPDVTVEDVVLRQAMAGGKYLLYSDGSTVEDLRRHTEKARNIRLMYEYIQENRAGNYEIPWSVWLEQEMLENAA